MKRKRYPRWLTIIQGIYSIFFPPISERQFIRIMGQWWLRTRGFRAQGMVGPYRPDFISERRHQIIEIDGKIKIPADIVKQQEYFQRASIRDNYLFKKGYSILHIEARDVFTSPDEVRKMVKSWSKNPAKYIKEQTKP